MFALRNLWGGFWRWGPAGGKASAVVETQHAYWVLGSGPLAIGPHEEKHQGRGDDGGELWHPAWHQLYPEETHHQSIPHLCHPPLLEHTAEVHASHRLCFKMTFKRYIECWLCYYWTTCSVYPCSINQTDQMLVHLQSFNSIPENYTIPESTKNGVPLFYIPPGSTTPVFCTLWSPK